MSQQGMKINRAGSGFMATGRVGDLNVIDEMQMLFDCGGKVFFHNLHMINIILQRNFFTADVVDDRDGVTRVM